VARSHASKRHRARRGGAKPDAEALLERGLVHHRAGRFDQAASAYEAAIRTDARLAAAHAMQGALFLQRGVPQEALTALDHAIALDSTQPGFFVNRGNALRALGRLDDAAEAYRGALSLDPRMLFAHNNLGNALRDKGQVQAAVAAYRNALEIDPRFFPAAANLALSVGKLSGTPKGELVAALELAITLGEAQGIHDPALANCHNALGNIQLGEGALERATASYRRALELDPRFGQAHLNLGQALARQSDIQGAIDALRSGLELVPGDVPSYRRLALLLRRLGRNAEAGSVYREWQAQAPGDPIAAHMSTALLGEAPPERASAEYVRREFDGFAKNFDDVLAKLGYKAPEVVGQALVRHGLAQRRDMDILDAGCGTGLCADSLRPLARRLVGLDLSAKMLELAARRGTYDELVEGDLLDWLGDATSSFDLVVAADVFIYFGDLRPVAAALRHALRMGGAVVFTVESAETDAGPYALGPGGRYCHAARYVDDVFTGCGFTIAESAKVRLREELGVGVEGRLVVALLTDAP
jgi:predicted TPR repeat methyltransferase